MRIAIAATTVCLTLMAGDSFAQPGPPPGGPPRGPQEGQFPGEPPNGRRGGRHGAGATNGSQLLVTRMLAFDKNDDGQLTSEEVTDQRLQRLFRRADADQDGNVTKAELTTVAAAIQKEFPNAGMRGPGGPGGPRGPRRGPPGGPPGGFPPPRDPPPEQ